MNGAKYTEYGVTVTLLKDHTEYPSSMYLKRRTYYADGTSSVWQTLRQFSYSGAQWVKPDGTYTTTDEIPHLVKGPSCPNLDPCVPVERVEYTLFSSDQSTVLATKTVTPNVDTGGGGTDPGTDPGDGSGGTDPGDGGGTDPGGTDPGDGGGGSCTGCELLACPEWDELADKFADKIGDQIPPPPDWEEVADIFGDELVPRFERAMENALENTLGHPPDPPAIQQPSTPTFDGTVENTPKPVDSMPPAQKHDFSTVPDIQVNPDNTGGIDLRNADPTDNIPHDAPDYMPMPGKENGGITPQTKPIETPMPSDGGVPQPPDNSLPAPGTSSGEVPVPGTTNVPPPAPELPMPQ